MNAEMEAIRRQMEGIIALLLALATLADRACRAPSPVRAHIMSILLPAEAVALDFVSLEAGVQALPSVPGDDPVADMANLAARFRLLACALAGVVARLLAAGRLEARRWWSLPACARDAMGDELASASPATLAFDTS